jgi:hypothetical protein
LLLSPHVFLLGILFRHQAFKATSLVSCKDIERLDIHSNELELPLPLCSDLNDTFVFRRVIKTVTGYEISATERVTYGMIAGWIKSIGVILGMEYSTILYSLRYNAANGLDQSRMCLPPCFPRFFPRFLPCYSFSDPLLLWFFFFFFFFLCLYR